MRLYDYAASANCYKVRLLLAQLGVEVEHVPVDIFAGETLTDEYLRKNPAAETPVLELDSGEFLPESNAILLYLADGSPFVPTRLEERAQVWRWLIYEQALLERRIAILRARLDHAVIVEAGESNVVSVGSHVVVEDEAGERIDVEISSLGGRGAVSPSSPLGAALLGKALGDTASVPAPRGAWKATIVEIRPATG